MIQTRLHFGWWIAAACAMAAVAAFVIPVREAGERQAVYTTNAGELTGGALAGQTIQASRDNLSGVAIMFATYSGRENRGAIEFNLRRSIDDTTDLRTGEVQVSQLGDNQFYRFDFEPLADSAGQTYFFYVTAPEGEAGHSVTVDLNGQDPYHLGTAFLVRGQKQIDGGLLSRSGKPAADLAFEAYYTVPLRVATVHTAAAIARDFVQRWREDPSAFVDYFRAAAMAAVLLVFLFLGGWPRAAQAKFLLAGFFLLALLVRLMYAMELPLTNDEGNYLYDARTLLKGNLAGGDGYVKAPLVIMWISFWSFFNHSILAGRFSSIFISALTIFPLYVLGRELAGKRAGFAAAALWALLGVTTVFGIYVHTQPLAVFFGVCGLAVLTFGLRRPSGDGAADFKLLVAAGVLLGLGVISRKSILALGLVPLAFIVIESLSWRVALRRLILVGAGFLAVVIIMLGAAWAVYGAEGFWEAVGANSAEDGITAVDPSEVEAVRAYSIRGMTPFFRESLPLILLATIGFGVVLEQLAKVFAKAVWLLPLAVFWWAWSFFVEYEGESAMVFGMRELWYAMAAVVVGAALLPGTGKSSASARHTLSAALIGPLWVGGLVIFYMNWIKFHVNYVGEFLPPLVLLGGIAVPAVWERLKNLRFAVLRVAAGGGLFAVLVWALFVTNYVTYTQAHTGTFKLAALNEAAAWARENIPPNEAIFTGAAAVPYLSGHQVSLDIAHPRWYAYEFTRKDTGRINTFLPSAEDMVQAFREANWFLLDQQTAFSFLQEYSDIERGLEEDFESIKGISNGSNTLTFYRRVW